MIRRHGLVKKARILDARSEKGRERILVRYCEDGSDEWITPSYRRMTKEEKRQIERDSKVPERRDDRRYTNRRSGNQDGEEEEVRELTNALERMIAREKEQRRHKKRGHVEKEQFSWRMKRWLSSPDGPEEEEEQDTKEGHGDLPISRAQAPRTSLRDFVRPSPIKTTDALPSPPQKRPSFFNSIDKNLLANIQRSEHAMRKIHRHRYA